MWSRVLLLSTPGPTGLTKRGHMDIDKVIDIHRALWADGGGVISYENLFKAQELVDNHLLDLVNLGKVSVKQNLDGRIISVQRRAVKETT